MYRRELGRDLAALRRAGVSRLILLVTDEELGRWGDPEIVAHAAGAGIRLDRHPIPDGDPPASLEELESILAAVQAGRDEGDVAVACMGGVGRSGTIAACALVAAGWGSGDAVAEVRRVRHPTAVETESQLAFVARYADSGSHRRHP